MWQARDPIEAESQGQKQGAGGLALPVGPASSLQSPLALHPAHGTLEVWRVSIMSPLIPTPSAQLGVAF